MHVSPSRAARLAALATAALALVAPIASQAAVPAVGIPQGPETSSAVPFLGAPRPARPVKGVQFAPRHPFMAANGRSNLHDDAYQSDAGTTPGPLGYSPSVTSTLFTQECASVTFDAKGRLVTVCVGLATVDLRLLDPLTLELLADYPLPPRSTSSLSSPFTSFGGGGYFYLDHKDRAVVPTSDGRIDVIAQTEGPTGPGFVLEQQYDVSALVGSSVILSVLPDWGGRLWFVSADGLVGVVDPANGRSRAITLPHDETIGNSVAVDETGAVFVVSSRALYRFEAGRDGNPAIVWRKGYDGGTRQKPGQSQVGSGTTPTIIRRGTRHFVAITDNADPRMHVLVHRADRADTSAKPVCSVPVFGAGTGSTDNSLIAIGDAIVVENNYGYTGPVEQPPSSLTRGTPTSEPGVTRIDVDYDRGSCRVAWERAVRVPSSVSKASAATGLVYVYEHPSREEVRYVSGQEPVAGPEDPWYLTALDLRTGARVWSVLTGLGLGHNNNYAPITLGPDGTAYVGVLGGLLAVRDQR